VKNICASCLLCYVIVNPALCWLIFGKEDVDFLKIYQAQHIHRSHEGRREEGRVMLSFVAQRKMQKVQCHVLLVAVNKLCYMCCTRLYIINFLPFPLALKLHRPTIISIESTFMQCKSTIKIHWTARNGSSLGNIVWKCLYIFQKTMRNSLEPYKYSLFILSSSLTN
jgi:hypothetical protein